MLRGSRGLFLFRRQVHTLSRDGPSEMLKRKVAELEKKRKMKNPRKNELFVETPEPKTWLDTATMPMILTAVGVALFAKLLMMYDDSKSQETIERKIQHAPAGQGTVRMLTREEWEEFQEVRPTTPFESKLSRPNARLRTGEPLHMEDLKDWTIDVLTDALTRAEEIARHKLKTSSQASKTGAKLSGSGEGEGPSWAPLRDSYMLTNHKLKDWDKMQQDSTVADEAGEMSDTSSGDD